MYELLYVLGRDNPKMCIFDSKDFLVEFVSFDFVKSCLLQGTKIKGVTFGGTSLVYREIEKDLLYYDDNIAILDSFVEANDYQHNIEVIFKGADSISYSIGYNVWIKRNEDKISPKVVKASNKLYLVHLFGHNIGFSIVLMPLGNGVIKEIYRDTKYINKSVPLEFKLNGVVHRFNRV